MITADLLVDLARRFILRDDETIEWMKAFPEGPTVDIETADRAYVVRVAHGLLRVEEASWVEAVVVASREDEDVEGPSPRDTFLVRRDGAVIPLADPDAVAELGELLHSDDLPPMSYVEILVQGQWPGGWSKRVVVDPVAWRAAYPADAPLPPVGAPRVWREDEVLHLSFAASRQYAEAAGGRTVLDVSEWSVRAPAGAPATWQRRLIAEAVPLMPPW